MYRRLFVGAILCLFVFWVTSVAISEAQKKQESKQDLFGNIRLFSDTLAIIQSDYVDEIKPKDLIYGALKGMLSDLDPHSQFMDPETYNELKVDTRGQFGGIGVELSVKDRLLTVIAPIEDTPAWEAGIKTMDRIVKIDDEITRDMTLSEAVKRMRGKPGEVVRLNILRESENKILEFKITRDIIKIKNIKDAMILEEGIGYLRLVGFTENSARDLDAALSALKKDGMNAFILDLRNNPGGPFEASFEVAERFIENGKPIVYVQDHRGSKRTEFISKTIRPVLDLPMVVLINNGSASASEIVAASLQDYKKAIVLGTKSFGKGSVQTLIPLRDGSALKLTTNEYFSPLGRQIHNKGVLPDIVVEEGRIELTGKDESAADSKEAIFGELERKEKTVKEDEVKKEFDYKTDNQLMRAVDALKAIKIINEARKNDAKT